jgi:hypothetical protein
MLVLTGQFKLAGTTLPQSTNIHVCAQVEGKHLSKFSLPGSGKPACIWLNSDLFGQESTHYKTDMKIIIHQMEGKSSNESEGAGNTTKEGSPCSHPFTSLVVNVKMTFISGQ